jgi:hypothetical protein
MTRKLVKELYAATRRCVKTSKKYPCQGTLLLLYWILRMSILLISTDFENDFIQSSYARKARMEAPDSTKCALLEGAERQILPEL